MLKAEKSYFPAQSSMLRYRKLTCPRHPKTADLGDVTEALGQPLVSFSYSHRPDVTSLVKCSLFLEMSSLPK